MNAPALPPVSYTQYSMSKNYKMILVANVLNLKSHDLLMEDFAIFFFSFHECVASSFSYFSFFSLAPLCKMTNNEVMSSIIIFWSNKKSIVHALQSVLSYHLRHILVFRQKQIFRSCFNVTAALKLKPHFIFWLHFCCLQLFFLRHK